LGGVALLGGLPDDDRGSAGGERVRQGRSSFLKKRTKKLLRVWARSLRKGRSQNNQTFFGSFFKKEPLAYETF
jgi:hypothetical protein